MRGVRSTGSWTGVLLALLLGCAPVEEPSSDSPWVDPDPNPEIDDGSGARGVRGAVAVRGPGAIEFLTLGYSDAGAFLEPIDDVIPFPDGMGSVELRAFGGEWDRARSGLALDAFATAESGLSTVGAVQIFADEGRVQVVSHPFFHGARAWHMARDRGVQVMSIRGVGQLGLFGYSSEPIFADLSPWVGEGASARPGRVGYVGGEAHAAVQPVDAAGVPVGPGSILAADAAGALRAVASGPDLELWSPGWPSAEALVAVDVAGGLSLRRLDPAGTEGLGAVVWTLPDGEGPMQAALPDDDGWTAIVLADGGGHRVLCLPGDGEEATELLGGDGAAVGIHLALGGLLSMLLDDGGTGRLQTWLLEACGEPELLWELAVDAPPLGVGVAGIWAGGGA
jgi:hypothetical protein